MTDSFQRYREDFEGHRDDAANDVKALAAAASPAAREELRESAANAISEAERLLRILRVEARGGNSQARQSMQAQVDVYNKQVEQLKTSLERAVLVSGSQQQQKQQQRAAAQKTSPAGGNATHKDTLIRTQQQIDRHDDLLYDADVIVEETQQIATNITQNLSDQRGLLTNAQRNVEETREDALEAGDYLKSLKRKHSIQIGVLYVVIAMLVVAIIASAINKFG